MKESRSDRVLTLLKKLDLSPVELAGKVEKQPSTIYRIINGESEPTKTTLAHIARVTGASHQWLVSGRGEMMDPDGIKPDSYESDIWDFMSSLEELRVEYRELLNKKDEQISDLLAILKKLNFLKVSEQTGPAQVIPMSPAGVLRPAA